MKHHLFSLLLALSTMACGEPREDERDNGSNRGGASGFGGTSMTGGSSGVGVTGGSSGSGTAGSGAASGSGGGPLECNVLPADGPDYEVMYDAGPAPAGKGGTLLDGTYFATSEIWYDMAPGPPVTLGGIRVEVDGNIWEEADGWPPDDVANPEYRLTRFVSTLGTSLILTTACPTHGSLVTFEYTIEGDALTLYVRESGLTYGITFTHQ